MSEPFIGEIRMFGFNYPPKGWALCNGQILEISQNYSLYALIGISFGGDGQTTFALPDMRGRVPVHQGLGYTRGLTGGIEKVPLAQTQLAMHSHVVKGTTSVGNKYGGSPTASFATSTSAEDVVYGNPASLVNMGTGVVSACDGGGQGHNNMQPSQVVNFSISLDGIFPPRS